MVNVKERIYTAITSLSQANYIGSVLQVMRISQADSMCPTMGVMYDKKLKSIGLLYNSEFVNKLTDKELKAVFQHEIMHVLYKHIFLYRSQFKGNEKTRLNVAMDLVINQRIKNLPKDACFIENFKDKDGKVFPPNLTLEGYYDLLTDDATYKNSKGEEKMVGEITKPMDVHDWDDIEEKEALEGMGDLIKRAQNHYEKNHGISSKELQDCLDEVLKDAKGLDYKRILLSALKKSLPSKDIDKTWIRPSRRYGLLAKGNKVKPLPRIELYIDTSGSISYDELNEFLSVTRNFFTVGVKKTDVYFFHQKVYNKKTFKRGFKVTPEDVQSGGTDLQGVFDTMDKTRPDLAIILTDGYYDRPNVKKNVPKTVFIMKETSNKEHCLKDIGQTLVYK